MTRVLTRVAPFAFALAWAACSETPTVPTPDVESIDVTNELIAAPAATDAASLQAALDAAADNGGVVLLSGEIRLDEPLTYAGTNRLTLFGTNDARIVGPVVEIAPPSNSGARVGEETVGDGLQILGSADLRIFGVDFADQSGHGIYYEFSPDATGTTFISMTNVDFTGQGLAGTWIEDQTGGSESEPIVIDSDASISLRLRDVTVVGTGFADDPTATTAGSCVDTSEFDGCSWADFDGFRVNEGGVGDITFVFNEVGFFGNAGDGIEFDETGAGDVRGSVFNSFFNGNGAQPQFPADLEDGFDIDESGAGDIVLSMFNTEVNGNIDEGIDLDAADQGDIRLTAFDVLAVANADENIKASGFVEIVQRDGNGDVIFDDEGEAEVEVQCGTGDVVFTLVDVAADASNAGRGARFEECGEGDVRGVVRNSSFSTNTEDDGLRVDEEDGGSVSLRLTDVLAVENDGQGLQVTENGEGDIVAVILDSEFTDNGNTQIELEEADAGAHDVEIRGSTIVGDGEDSIDVIEEDEGNSVVRIVGSTVSPDPVAGEDDVDFQITP
jgi:hypothetical protein